MNGDFLRKLFAAHVEGDDAGFRIAAKEIIDEEYRRKHSVLARELERLLGNGKNSTSTERTQFLSLLGNNGHSPRDRDRGAVLVELTDPNRQLSDLVLSEGTRQALERVVEEQRRAELLRSHGLRPSGKVLFCGPPGCGKTVAAEAIAKEVYLPLAVVRFDAVISSYLGETASNLRKVFEFARSRPMVMLFDEFDAIGKRRTDPDEHGEIKRVVNSFLQMLDGFHGETLTIAATNHQGLLDRALWRRFDDIVFFALPSEKEIEKLLIDRLRQIKLSANVRIPSVARTLLGLAHADVERLAGEIVKRCVLQEKEEIDEMLVREVLELERSRRDLVADNAAQDSSQKTRKRQPPPRKRKG